jgi:hypothetical protein
MKNALTAVALAALLLSGCSRERLGPLPTGVHKRSASGPIAYYLDRSAGEALELGVREAFQLWSDATKFKFAYEGKTRAHIARDVRNEVVLLKKWPNELPIRAAAWSQAYLDSSGNIVEADILLNAQAYAFTTKREAKPGALYVEDVLSREIGKTLGLGPGIGEDSASGARAAAEADGFEPGIDPAEMAAYLSLYAAD